MNILYIDHYTGSTSMGMEFRPYYMALSWQKMGHNVTVLAADCSHLRIKNPVVNEDFEEQIIDGVKFCLVKTLKYKNSHSLKRYANMYSFKNKIEKNVDFLAERYKPDAVIASSTYPMDIYAAKKIAEKSGARLCFEIHDLWPLTLIVLYHLPSWFLPIRIIQKAEDTAFNDSDVIVSILPDADKHIIERGADASKFIYIPNGVIPNSNVEPMPHEHLNLFEKLKAEGKFIVLYAGGHTSANELETFIKSSPFMPENTALVMVGDGHLKTELINFSKNFEGTGCDIHFLPSVRKNQIPSVLSQGDCLYIGAKKCHLYQYGVGMNKIYDYMLSGKPIIYAIEASNNPIEESRGGVTAEAENPQAIADAVVKLKKLSFQELEEMGNNAREYVIKNHNYDTLSQRFIDALKEEK